MADQLKPSGDLPGVDPCETDPEDETPEMVKDKPKAATPADILALCKENGVEPSAEMFGLSIENVALRILRARKAAEPKLRGEPAHKPGAGLSAIDRAAAQIQASDPLINKHQAVARALRANPELYDQWDRQAATSRPSASE
mgnify:FL=1